ncbi:hypothetical protein Anapl_06243 [Anas platyrhynchos]|uniref:Uncharacterized protein n=1 Tax=Anas platyrhynchos TaxID=8839 RepID=R0LPY0_ANAPL|nr:hypothetical protein Anapl_06243 [Anas platyrhynchos]
MACLVRQPFRVTGPSMASLKAGLKDSVEILLPSVQNQRNGKGSRILQVNLLSTWEMWAAMGWGSGELHRETCFSLHHSRVCFPLIATHGVTRRTEPLVLSLSPQISPAAEVACSSMASVPYGKDARSTGIGRGRSRPELHLSSLSEYCRELLAALTDSGLLYNHKEISSVNLSLSKVWLGCLEVTSLPLCLPALMSQNLPLKTKSLVSKRSEQDALPQSGFVIKRCGFLIKAHSYPEYIFLLARPQAQAAEAVHQPGTQQSIPQLGPFVPAYFLLTG